MSNFPSVTPAIRPKLGSDAAELTPFRSPLLRPSHLAPNPNDSDPRGRRSLFHQRSPSSPAPTSAPQVSNDPDGAEMVDSTTRRPGPTRGVAIHATYHCARAPSQTTGGDADGKGVAMSSASPTSAADKGSAAADSDSSTPTTLPLVSPLHDADGIMSTSATPAEETACGCCAAESMACCATARREGSGGVVEPGQGHSSVGDTAFPAIPKVNGDDGDGHGHGDGDGDDDGDGSIGNDGDGDGAVVSDNDASSSAFCSLNVQLGSSRYVTQGDTILCKPRTRC